MRMRISGWMGTFAALGVLVLAVRANADEMDIPLDQVPKPVMDAAKAKFPGALMRGASKETENDKTVFEVSLTHQNHKMDVTFTPDGTLDLVETEVAETEVPAAVNQAVKVKYPGAKVNLLESVKRGPELKRDADYYEFHLTTADKKSVEVEVDAQGKILKTEEGGEDEGKEKG
jgi:uncharacterized membrane protein YkoI